MLTQKEVRRLFNYNKRTGILKWKISSGRAKIGNIAGSVNDKGYIQIGINGKQHLAHRLIWLYVKGYFPEHGIDHKNRIRHDNRWTNLREESQQCNMRNCGLRSDNTSGIKGVFFNKQVNKWQVQIQINKKVKYLGYYDNFDEAVLVRYNAEKELNWNRCDNNSPAYQYVKKNMLDQL